MMKEAAVMAIGLLISTAIGAEAYVCIAESAVGFALNKTTGTWHEANFKQRGKYVVSRSSRKEFAWEAKEVGMSVALIFCKNDFDAKGTLTCDVAMTKLRINRITGRFLSSTPFGYWNDKLSAADDDPMRDGANSPYREIGKCSPL